MTNINTINSAIIAVSEAGLHLAHTIKREIPNSTIYTKHATDDGESFDSYASLFESCFADQRPIIFIGATGICLRSMVHCIGNKYSDPPVVVVDSMGHHAISLLSGHVGGGNELAEWVARITGGSPVITTQSDNSDLWALDLLSKRFGWHSEADAQLMNEAIFHFVSKRPTTLLLEVKDKGTDWLEHSCPEHVTIIYSANELAGVTDDWVIAVTPFVRNYKQKVLTFVPRVMHMGVGCRRDCRADGVYDQISKDLLAKGINPLAIASVSTIVLKKDEPLVAELHDKFAMSQLNIYSSETLEAIEVPNPSEKVLSVTGANGVSESSAIKASALGRLVIEKVKGMVHEGNQYTYAVAIDRDNDRHEGHIEFVGAGPGDPELVSVRGKRLLQQADLILYAGSLVPEELTHYAKAGATVRSSADMNLEEQIEIMYDFYRRGLQIVRLHTGDPCIYGAIAEQMALMDEIGMHYHITPGISSFLAAAAELKSEFTIPEEVQTIILTRGEGRTPMPEKEKLHLLARSQSTMCIYLSASIVDKVQAELLECYPPETPVAACYKLTWKEQKIYRGVLKDLSHIVKSNNLRLTTMIVVGKAIDHRQGVSRLYADEFKHLFRK